MNFWLTTDTRSFFGVIFLLFGLMLVENRLWAVDETVQFNRDVRPILSDKCFACHGFDEKKREAGLRLDVPPEGDWSKWVIVPGDPDASLLWERITTEDQDLHMPPAHSHKHLTEAEKAILRKWIQQGAAYQGHWSLQKIQPSIAVPNIPGVSNPIDRFIQDRLNQEGLTPSPVADKATLIRRVSFALTGLPPTREQVQAFLTDTRSDAYEHLVDELLSSPNFGEEMARHWLDVARYADTHGLHLDNERQMWAYRDWVIAAFNQNKPFDEFTIEQLAGDLLPNPTQEQQIATGFNRCNVTTSEGGSIDAEFLFRYAVERASTTAEAWMGLTAGCAVCHDHKFDPISQSEFYSLYAFFYSAADPAMDGNALLTNPVMRIETEADRARMAELRQQISSAREELLAAVRQVAYVDPAASSTPTAVSVIENWWMDDEFVASGRTQASPGHATEFVSAPSSDTAPISGHRVLKRTDAGLAQDVWEATNKGLPLPPQAKFTAHVYLDPANLPKTIMIQFNKGGWNHRAVWGDYDAIQWGAAQTHERVAMGELPAAGKWVPLEFPVQTVGLAAGDEVSGFALTQFGGTVYWDKVGVVGEVNPANDPAFSFQAWWRAISTSDLSGIPSELHEVAKQGPSDSANADSVAKLREHYLLLHCQTTRTALATFHQGLLQAEQQLRDLEAGLASTFVFADLPTPRQAHVMTRGQYDQPGAAVEPNVPKVLPALIPSGPRANRLDLARWLVSPEHPLTARVAVNRYWQQFFGSGLVQTSTDFGSQGAPPSHPELLDWLANEFKSNGWNVKALVRLLVTSETFKQSSAVSSELFEKDPKNRLYARMSRPRLDAEQIRDNALFVSGLLVPDRGGKGVKPYQPPNIWEPVGFAGSNTRFYARDNGPALYRRSIYTFLKRTAPPPFMSNFDAPNREQSCSVRQRSNTPLQALQLMNDVQHIEAARVFATRLLADAAASDDQRIRLAVQIVLTREPTEQELSILLKQLAKHRDRYQGDTEAAQKLIAMGDTPAPAESNATDLAAYTLMINTLMNLDETLTRN
ncbi:MAG: PSD1 domain-containing protein [Planctomycetaceae bacterium]|nr:PSD1 domain-containing protein [Planctomycetaceae bacterium]